MAKGYTCDVALSRTIRLYTGTSYLYELHTILAFEDLTGPQYYDSYILYIIGLHHLQHSSYSSSSYYMYYYYYFHGILFLNVAVSTTDR